MLKKSLNFFSEKRLKILSHLKLNPKDKDRDRDRDRDRGESQSFFSEIFSALGAVILIGMSLGILSGCASSDAKTPCKNYGLFCSKTPINSWSSK